jgi:exopolysaccharide production protein ExoQ
MPKFSAFLAGALIAIMSMPSSINLLAPLGGELFISLAPLVIACGLLLGSKIIFQQFAKSRRLLRSTNRYLLVFLLLASLSVLWSGFPATTAYRLVRLYAMFFICFSFSMVSWDPQKFTSTLQSTLLFLTLGSIVYYFLAPVNATQESVINGMVQPELVGAWRGITSHKNTLGAIASTAVILFFHTLYSRTGPKLGAGVGLVCASICLINSRSSTSLFAALFAIALIVLILKTPGVKKPGMVRLFTFLLVMFFLVYSLGVLNIVPGLSAIVEPIVAMTGKDMTFSGRTTIWAIMKDEIARHPILGTGYAAFWLGADPLSPSAIFKLRMYIDPGEAHNGYLDVINELGSVGMLALIGYLFTYLRQAMLLLGIDRKKAALFIALLFAELIANMSEAHWWNLASVNFFILTLASFDLGRSILESKRKRPVGRSGSSRPLAPYFNGPTAPQPATSTHQDRLERE